LCVVYFLFVASFLLDSLSHLFVLLPLLPLLQPLREESAGYVWDLIQNCLDILGISEEEALGLWSLLAAIYHLGFAGVKKGKVSPPTLCAYCFVSVGTRVKWG